MSTVAPGTARGGPGRGSRLLEELRTSSALVTVLAVLLAFLAGGVLIAAADPATRAAAGYFFARPSDLVVNGFSAAAGAYGAMLRGALFDPQAPTLLRQVRPITETLTIATPLIAAGLGVALAFRAGLFNIGAQGQILVGAAAAGYVGFSVALPPGVHLLAALVAGCAAGAAWGGIAGYLRARTGAHEVITTIMLNYVALYLVAYLLARPLFQRPGASNPISPVVAETAELPLLLGEGFRVHLGLLLVLGAAAAVWWLLERSTLGFRFRAVGANPPAARTAGMSVPGAYLGAMLLAGLLSGLAGAAQVLGTEKAVTGGIAGSLGPDAITVALLGRSHPAGVIGAGLLFGALRAGAPLMQAQTGTPVDIVLVVQSVIVLLIAAPPLVRAVFGLNRRSGDRPGRRGRGTPAAGDPVSAQEPTTTAPATPATPAATAPTTGASA